MLKKLCVLQYLEPEKPSTLPKLDTGDILCPKGAYQEACLTPGRKALSFCKICSPFSIDKANMCRLAKGKCLVVQFYSQSIFGPERQSIDN